MLQVIETFPYETKIGKKIVRYRGWKTKEEKAYLIASESKEDITLNDMFDILIRPCIENKEIYLNTDEIQKLLIDIRKVSLGETFEIKFVCQNPNCKQINDVEVNFNDVANFRNETLDTITIENYLFSFGSIKNVDEFKARIKDKNDFETQYMEMVSRIDKVTIDGNLEDTFTYDEIYNFIENLDTKIFDKLFKYYNDNISELELEGEVTCFSCGEKNRFLFDELPNFLGDW